MADNGFGSRERNSLIALASCVVLITGIGVIFGKCSGESSRPPEVKIEILSTDSLPQDSSRMASEKRNLSEKSVKKEKGSRKKRIKNRKDTKKAANQHFRDPFADTIR